MKKVIVCVNQRSNPGQPSCAARGGVELADLLEREIRQRNIAITLERFHCLGRCDDGPNLKLVPGGKFHSGASLLDNVAELLREIELFAGRGQLKLS